MAILDAALLYGAESTYGTFVSVPRAYEAKADPWKRKVDFIASEGMRAGMQTLRSDRSRAINMGAEGGVEVDFLNKGMGLILRDLFGSTTGPTLISGVTFEQVHSTTKDGPLTSASVQLLKPLVDGSTEDFTYLGCVAKGFELSCEVGSYLKLKADFDARDERTDVTPGTPTYPATASPFDWTMADFTINAAAVDFKKWSVKGDYGMNTDRRFLKTGGLKKIPRVAKVPEYTGELEGEFESLTHYNRFIAGTVVPAAFVFTGGLIEAGQNFKVTVDLAAIQYSGETPEVSLSELPKQMVPFRILHDGTNPAVKVTIRSSDAAL